MRVVIRADATAAIGLGHLKRCLALAQALHAQGAEVRLVGRLDGALNAAWCCPAGLTWLDLPSPSTQAGAGGTDRTPDTPHAHWLPSGQALDARQTLALIEPWQPQVIVVDHYALSAPWHQAVRAATGAAIAVIDDLADRPLAADLLIDHNPAADHHDKYRAVLPDHVPICAGLRHALLDTVYSQHARSIWHPQVQTIGIFMGGTDPADHSRWVLDVLRQQAGWSGRIIVATTSGNPHARILAEHCLADGHAALFMDLPHLADFHAACDLQIGAGGGAQWERCCLGVPTIALTCAPNQQQTVRELHEAGVVFGMDAIGQTTAQAQVLADALLALLDNDHGRAMMRDKALALVDGQGAQRVATALHSLANNHGQAHAALHSTTRSHHELPTETGA